MTYIRWFQEVTAGDVEQVGGKGANLGEMARLGLPVPPGFCLAATAYRDFIEATGLKNMITAILDQPQRDTEMDHNPARIEVMAHRIRNLITEQEIPADIARQLLANYRLLGQELGAGENVPIPVAVRSSATAEDLPTASFAGQQDTHLNVCGEEALLRRIRDCWASLWTARAVTYREKQGFDHNRVYLAVVIQAMIPSEISGVMFTANPVTGNRDESVINASWGLGEAIVSGLVTPDTYTVDKNTGVVLSQEIPSKDRAIVYDLGGGTVEQEIAQEQRQVAALSAEQISTLVSLGRTLESHYKSPQDVEWGFAGDKVFLLQSRAITTLKSQPSSAAIGPEYNRSMFLEIFPDPLSPIFLSVIRHMFGEMLRFTFTTLGLNPPQEMEAVGVFYNQPYFNQDYIEAALQPLPAPLRAQLVGRIVNPFGQSEGKLHAQLTPRVAGMAIRLLGFMVRFPHQLPMILRRYRQEVAEVRDLPYENLPDEVLVGYIRRLVFGSANLLMNNDFLMIALIGITCQIMDRLLAPIFGAESETVRGRLTSGVTGNITMVTNQRLWDLAEVAKASPTVSGLLRAHDVGSVRSQLQQSIAGQDFLEKLDAFLAEFGHREARMDILYPTWGEDPSLVLGFVRSYLDANESQSPYHQQERLVRQRQETTDLVESRLKKTFKGRFLVLPLFRWILHHTLTHARERDTVHFELTRLFPPFRRLLLTLGQRWSAAGRMAAAGDIFFLSFEEIEDCARHPGNMESIITSHRAAFEANHLRPAPDIIRGGTEIASQAQAPELAGQEQLRGVAGSPGLATGVARVIRGPEDFGKLQAGEILVAPYTNPVWTPLFAIAGGLITEVGGILSHGAIVAREYGISAVMGVPGATRLVQEGQVVTVDGNQGIVWLGTQKEEEL